MLSSTFSAATNLHVVFRVLDEDVMTSLNWKNPDEKPTLVANISPGLCLLGQDFV